MILWTCRVCSKVNVTERAAVRRCAACAPSRVGRGGDDSSMVAPHRWMQAAMSGRGSGRTEEAALPSDWARQYPYRVGNAVLRAVRP